MKIRIFEEDEAVYVELEAELCSENIQLRTMFPKDRYDISLTGQEMQIVTLKMG